MTPIPDDVMDLIHGPSGSAATSASTRPQCVSSRARLSDVDWLRLPVSNVHPDTVTDPCHAFGRSVADATVARDHDETVHPDDR